MGTRQFTNPDRKRYYGLRPGDTVMAETKICRVERLGFMDNNRVHLKDLETGEVFDYVAEWCELLMKVEDKDKGKSMKTYVITLSKAFPKGHKKAGEATKFAHLLGNALFIKEEDLRHCKHKKHTIRANFPLWEKRISEVQNGLACLSIRQWTGKPYRSKQVEIARLTAEDGVGIQKLSFYRFPELPFIDGLATGNIAHTIAAHDGLPYEDWVDWFKAYDLEQPLAIIHFTSYRY